MDFKLEETRKTAHRYFSSGCFNETWSYLDEEKPDSASMLSCAYASLYHWQKREDVKISHLITAHWLLARAYEKAQLSQGCRLHADKVSELVTAEKLLGMELLSAYEVQARATALEGDKVAASAIKEKGIALLNSLRAEIGEEEYGYCKEDLDTIIIA